MFYKLIEKKRNEWLASSDCTIKELLRYIDGQGMKGVCPTNMVLQTSCRCLRQVIKGNRETALIWLNKFNADKLNRQLEQQQNITLKEFADKSPSDIKQIDRYSRMERMQVPPIKFYQLKVSYEALVVDEANDTAKRLQEERTLAKTAISLIHQQDFEGKLLASYEQEASEETRTSFSWWLQQIAKESFGTLTVADLKTCEKELHTIFARITTNKEDGVTIENNAYHHQHIRSLIRQAFAPIRMLKADQEKRRKEEKE